MEDNKSVVSDVALLFGSWLVPGLGFLAKGKYRRGILVFLLINGTFLLGLLLHGAVIIPEFRFRSPAFNIVNLLTFIGQLGNAGASLFSLVHEQRGWTIFSTIESHAWFDLASLYLLVSGCMNYFCVVSFYDQYIGRHAETPLESKSTE